MSSLLGVGANDGKGSQSITFTVTRKLSMRTSRSQPSFLIHRAFMTGNSYTGLAISTQCYHRNDL